VAFDPYRILGIERDTSEDEIRKVYRALARRYHPDLNKGPDAEEHFKDIAQAFSILTDARKRELFDHYGEASLQLGFQPHQQPAPPRHPTARGRPERRPEPRWEQPDPRPDRAPPGENQDVMVLLEIELITAITGGDVRAQSPLTGAPLSVSVPPGAETGLQICLQGRGRPGRGGRQPGDLYFEIQILPHPFFRREGWDLVLELPITIEEAYHGARLQIPTLEGWMRVRIPAGSRGGERLRVKGQGIPDSYGHHGDLYVHLCIRLPDRLDVPGRSLDRVGSLYTESVRAGLRL